MSKDEPVNVDQPVVEAIRNQISPSAMTSSDKTGARVDERNWWEWVFRSATEVHLDTHPSREEEVIAEVIDVTQIAD